MEGRCRIWLACGFVAGMLVLVRESCGQPPELVRSWQHDASLHDVQWVSRRVAWAVGDHGAVWQTADSGSTWQLANAGSLTTLRSVCLLTDQVGWIAGWQSRGAAELTDPVLLMTRDAGQSWESLDVSMLSPLRYVRFFGLDEGLVIGEPTRNNPTGVWGTTDAGKSWEPVGGPVSSGWNHAALASPELGLLAARDGNLLLLAGPQLLPSRLPVLKGRSIRGVALSSEHRGWLVGDGGLVMTSASGGVVWESPEGEFPAEIRDVADFRTVAVKDSVAWIAGSPGGIIWKTRDQGRRWTKHPTGITTPLNKLQFVNESQGAAVGELGVILVTSDGGETWTAAQGRGRHVALLSIHHRLSSVAFETTAKLSGEQGYRSAAWLAVRPVERQGGIPVAERLQAGLSAAGGSSGAAAWTLPLETPGLELHADRLQAAWQRRTEGRLPQVLLGGLVRQIRQWRPQVVILEQPAPEDAAGQLLHEAALKAIDQAADGTRFLMQRELGGLTAWNVERVYLQLLPGNTGELSVDPFEFLPRWQTSLRLAAAPARAFCSEEAAPVARPNYRAIDLSGAPTTQPRGTDFFSGLNLVPGGEVRRELPPINDRNLDQQIKAAQRHRNFLAQVETSSADSRIARQMLAQLQDVTVGMSPGQSARTLFDLFTEYRLQGCEELAEAVAQELLRRYPQQDVTAEAARWLLVELLSEEVAWRRVRQPQDEPSAIRQASFRKHIVQMPDLKQRLAKATNVWRQLEATWPQLAKSPDLEFPLATLYRQRNSHNLADDIYRRWLPAEDAASATAWSEVARRELWLAQRSAEEPPGVATCFRTATKPQLDGVLSDDCWQSAAEWTLKFRSPAEMPESAAPLVMLASDDEYLYLAATVPRVAGLSSDQPKLAGRAHDADLRRHDRLTIRLDMDRDYQTWYTFQVDQRGWTAEACREDARWNPRWFVAADGDDDHWRIEAAIPWTELTPKRPEAGAAWGMSLERTAPAVGRQGWLRPSSGSPVGNTLGMLVFD